MNTWTESLWFVDLVSRIREAEGEALSLIEDYTRRFQTDTFLLDHRLHTEPQTLSGRKLVTELVKAMTRDRHPPHSN